MTDLSSFRDNIVTSWGSFCSHCGQAMSGEFPRRCENGHMTYGHDREGVVVMQPVELAYRQTGLLVVRRNIKPFIGKMAMVSGHKDRGKTFEQVIRSEIKDETSLEYPDNAGFIYRGDYLVDAADPETDGRIHHITVFEAPPIGVEQMPWDYTHPEVQEVGLIVYDGKALQDYKQNVLEMGFRNHVRLALEHLVPRYVR